MKGCFRLFPGSNTVTAKLVQQAFERQRTADEAKKKLAGWWDDILAEVADFRANGSKDDFQTFTRRVLEIDGRRQAWLKRNGYGRTGPRA